MIGKDVGKYLTVRETVGALRRVIETGGSLEKELEVAVREILKVTGNIESYYQKDWQKILEILEEIEEQGKAERREEELATSAVPTGKIRELLEEYEAARKKGIEEAEATRRIEERENGKIARTRIRQWIAEQEKYRKMALEALERAAPQTPSEERELVAEKTAERQVVLGEEVRVLGGKEETVAKVVAEIVKTCVQAATGAKIDRKQVDKAVKTLERELPRDVEQAVAEEVRSIPRQVADEVRVEKIKIEVTKEIVSSLKRDGIIRDDGQERILQKVLESEVESVLRGSWPEETRTPGRRPGLKDRVAEAIGTTQQIVGREAKKELETAEKRSSEIRRRVSEIAENITTKIEREMTGKVGEIKSARLKVRVKEEISEQLAKTTTKAAIEETGIPKILVGIILREVQLPEAKIEEIVKKQSEGLRKIVEKNKRYFENILGALGRGKIVGLKIRGKEDGVRESMGEWWRERLSTDQPEEILPTSLIETITQATGTTEEEIGPYIKQLNVVLTKSEVVSEGIRTIRQIELEDRIERDVIENKKNISTEERQVLWQYKKLVGKLYYPDKEKDISVYEAGARMFVEGRGASPGKVDEAWNELRGITGFLRMSPRETEAFIARYKQLKKILGETEGLPLRIGECRSLDGIVKLIDEVPQVRNLLNLTQRFVAITEKFNGLTGGLLQKIGLEKVGISMVEKFGGQAMGEFVRHSLTVIAEQGTQKGIMAILNGVLGGGVSAGSGAATGGAAAGGGGALAGAVAAFQAIPAVGQVILVAALVVAAAVVFYNTTIKPIVGAIKGAIDSVLGVFGIELESITPSIKKFVSQDMGLGNIAGSIADFGFKVGAGVVGIVVVPLLAIPSLLATMSMAALGPIVAAIFIGMIILNQIDLSPKIAGLVPPKEIGGGCINQSSGAAGVNCNPNAPEATVDGVGKNTDYEAKVNSWYTRGGENAALKCFNHAVCLSRSAGIDPKITLAIWLSESAASNYETTSGMDFGINIPSVPKRNFMRQIEEFLTQPAGMLSQCEAMWGGRYSKTEIFLATFSRTVAGSCPDPGTSNYLNYFRLLFSHVTNGEALPDSPFVSPENGDCGGEGGEDWGLSDTRWCDVGAGVGGTEVMPVAPPDWTPGPVPEGCPDRLPVNGGHYTQGPFAPGCSHQNMSSPAIDIGIPFGSAIFATHPGKARAGADSTYGNYVEVQGSCNGQVFTTKYAHMPEIPFMGVIDVAAGDQIGKVDNTGSSTGNHIHYHITGLDKNNFCSYLGIGSVDTCNQLWACCGPENGKTCP